ncbi:alpha/beta hydrolase [Microbispora sp. NPDC049633]|uniref:alpha/beta fold hydrolase n=1 Tax=Microbispora sp. NPDC049633 TaxID=3154355 RepID=UPI0034466751
MTDHASVQANGVRIAYRTYGTDGGVPLVLLHGLGEGMADWAGVAPVLAAHRHVYALDLRGHGASGRPGTYGLELMRDDVLAFLDALSLGTVDVIGHSMGGLVAYLLAAERPDRVRTLILEDVPIPVPREPPPLVRPEGPLPFDWAMVTAIRPEIDRPDPAWLERLGRITARTLVIGGGPDSHIPQDRVAEMARRVPGAAHVTIPAGHLVHENAPGAFVREVLAFLG